MKKRKRIGIFFGGKSAEHDVSIQSGKAIFTNIDRTLYDPIPVYINRDGEWVIIEESDIGGESVKSDGYQSFLPWEVLNTENFSFDIAFPVLHGPNGEDGKIQGLFEMAGLPYVGADSFSSAIAMDKIVSKILFKKNGLDTADFIELRNSPGKGILKRVNRDIGFPCYVKPCSLGSSIGISRVKNQNELENAIKLAFNFDSKIIIEKEIRGMEIEVSVMGNKEIKVSRPGSFIPSKEFYDYEDKYILGKTEFFIPAELEKNIEDNIKSEAKKAFRALYLNGFARVDFFLEDVTKKIIINEINAIPGFTEISMFPKLWEIEGIGFKQLITELIGYGFEQFENRNNLKG